MPVMLPSRTLLLSAIVVWTSLGGAQDLELLPAIEDTPRSFSLADVESMAIANSPDLLAAQQRVQAALGRAEQAGLKPNPTIGYESEEIGADNSAGLHGVFLEQEILRGGKLAWRSEVHLREAQRLIAQADLTRQRVLNGAGRQFWLALAAQREIELREKLARTAEDAVKIADRLKNNGKLSRPEELMIIIEGRRATMELVQARTEYRGARRELAAMIGVSASDAMRLNGELETTATLGEQATLQRALQNSPQVHAAMAKIDRDCAAVERAQAEAVPNAHLRLSTQYSFETRDQVAAAEIGFKLPLFDRNQGGQYEAASDLAAAHAELHAAQLRTQRRHAAIFAEYEAAREHVASLATQLSDATEAYNMYQEAFALRRVGYMDVLNAQRTYFEIELQYLDALVELRLAEVALDGLLVGMAEDRLD